MTLLHRRLASLEQRYPPIVVPNPKSELQIQALVSLLPEELALIHKIVLRDGLEGPFDDSEQLAMDHYRNALQAVCGERRLN